MTQKEKAKAYDDIVKMVNAEAAYILERENESHYNDISSKGNYSSEPESYGFWPEEEQEEWLQTSLAARLREVLEQSSSFDYWDLTDRCTIPPDSISCATSVFSQLIDLIDFKAIAKNIAKDA